MMKYFSDIALMIFVYDRSPVLTSVTNVGVALSNLYQEFRIVVIYRNSITELLDWDNGVSIQSFVAIAWKNDKRLG